MAFAPTSTLSYKKLLNRYINLTQTIASFIKNEYTPKILSKLDKSIANEMLQTAERLGVNLNLKPVHNEKKTAEPAKPKKKVSEL